MRVIDKRIRQHKQVFARHEFYARSHEIRFDSGLHHPRGFVGRRLMIGPEFRNHCVVLVTTSPSSEQAQ